MGAFLTRNPKTILQGGGDGGEGPCPVTSQFFNMNNPL